jgi:hypothetical protein
MKAGLLEWMFIARQIPLPIESVLVNACVYGNHYWHPDHIRVVEESMIDRSFSMDSIPAAHLSITAPPATSSTTPVIQPASPEARKTAAHATSSGVPRRLSG